MSTAAQRCLAAVIAAGSLTGCAASATSAGGPPRHTPAGFTENLAVSVLSAFDASDSAASSSGDLTALARNETGTALATSTAAVHQNKSAGRTQPAFRHSEPTFAVGSSAAGCFLVAATISSTGDEMGHPDLSQFVHGADGQWRLSDNVLVASAGQAVAQSLEPAASTPQQLVPTARLDGIAAELFARSTAASTKRAFVASSVLLDQQFSAGWTIYRQQMATYAMTVTRTRDNAQWSRCAARAGDAAVAFVTLGVTDTIRSTKGKAVLPAAVPDVVGVGRSSAVTGSTITVHRVQEFLVAIPSHGAADVLGLSDAPTSITTTP